MEVVRLRARHAPSVISLEQVRPAAPRALSESTGRRQAQSHRRRASPALPGSTGRPQEPQSVRIVLPASTRWRQFQSVQ